MSEKKQLTVIERKKKDLHQYLERMGPEIARVVSRHMTPDKMAAIVYTEAARVPKILDCLQQNPGSVASTIMLAAQLGLDVSGPLGHFYLIPRNMKDPTDQRRKVMTLTYIIGYKGFVELANRSPEIKRVNAHCVYSAELPENGGAFHWKDEPPECDHPRAYSIDRSDDELVGAYAVVELHTGARIQLFLEREEIGRRQKRAQTQKFWDSDYAAMCRKTALRALLNGGLVPLTTELAVAIDSELTHERLNVIDAEPPRPRVADPLRGRLGLTPEPKPEPEPEPTATAEPERVDVDSLPLLEGIAYLEGLLDTAEVMAAGDAADVNPEADLEGQGEKLKAYYTELKTRAEGS